MLELWRRLWRRAVLERRVEPGSREKPPPEEEEGPFEVPEVVEVPIDGVLDLHGFAPRDVEAVVEAYLEACRARGVLAVRLIHGKGKGVQKRAVERVLARHPAVRRFGPGGHGAGGWGATLAELEPPGAGPDPAPERR